MSYVRAKYIGKGIYPEITTETGNQAERAFEVGKVITPDPAGSDSVGKVINPDPAGSDSVSNVKTVSKKTAQERTNSYASDILSLSKDELRKAMVMSVVLGPARFKTKKIR